MRPSVDEIKRVFFEATVGGYAADGPREDLPDGSKQHRYIDGDWEVTDRYWVNQSGFSWGQTLIKFRGEPVWIMQYWGSYPKEVIPFLKSVLWENYSRRIFVGGRGPEICHQSELGLRYVNHLERSRFEDFAGWEDIRGATEKGRHSYHGGLLFKPE